MGFFSWVTQDTNKSIANNASLRDTFPVVMIDNKGNRWNEKNYEGYGVFGGKDYYELLAEMNGITSDLKGEEYTEEMRLKGIDLAFKDNGSGDHTSGVLYPNLIENPDGWEYDPAGPAGCGDQGFFYDDGEEDEDEWEQEEETEEEN